MPSSQPSNCQRDESPGEGEGRISEPFPDFDRLTHHGYCLAALIWGTPSAKFMVTDLNTAWFHMTMASKCLEQGLPEANEHIQLSIQIVNMMRRYFVET